jgi:hypothetical protein
MRSFSIKRRIVTAVVVTELVLVACLLFLATSVLRSHAIRSFDTALRGRALAVAALVRYSEGPQPELVFDNSQVPSRVKQGAADWFHIETQDGRVLASSQLPGFERAAAGGEGDAWDFFRNGVPYRAVRLREVPVLDSEDDVPAGPVTLQVIYAASTRQMQNELDRAFVSILLGGMLLLAISLYASVRAIEKGLHPLAESLPEAPGRFPDQGLDLPGFPLSIPGHRDCAAGIRLVGDGQNLACRLSAAARFHQQRRS